MECSECTGLFRIDTNFDHRRTETWRIETHLSLCRHLIKIHASTRLLWVSASSSISRNVSLFCFIFGLSNWHQLLTPAVDAFQTETLVVYGYKYIWCICSTFRAYLNNLFFFFYICACLSGEESRVSLKRARACATITDLLPKQRKRKLNWWSRRWAV